MIGKRRKDLYDRLILSFGLPNNCSKILYRANEKQKPSDSLNLTYETGRTRRRSHARPVITRCIPVLLKAVYITAVSARVIFVGNIISAMKSTHAHFSKGIFAACEGSRVNPDGVKLWTNPNFCVNGKFQIKACKCARSGNFGSGD